MCIRDSNPVELVWTQVKLYILEGTAHPELQMLRDSHTSIGSISNSTWTDCIRYTEELQKEDFNGEICYGPSYY